MWYDTDDEYWLNDDGTDYGKIDRSGGEVSCDVNQHVLVKLVNAMNKLVVEGVSIEGSFNADYVMEMLSNPAQDVYLEAQSGEVPDEIREFICEAYSEETSRNKVNWESITDYMNLTRIKELFSEVYGVDSYKL